MLTNILIAAKRLVHLVPLFAVVLAGALASAPAEAQWHHRYYGPRVGVYIGPGYPGYYYPPPYYYPPAVAVAPPVYVEQGQSAAVQPAPAQNSSWYYCAASRSYYPYVKECAAGWQQVAPQPNPPQ